MYPRKVPPDTELIKILSDRTRGFRELAQQIGVHPNTITQHARRLGFAEYRRMPTSGRQPSIFVTTPEEDSMMVNMYSSQKMSIKKVADHFSVGEWVIRRRLQDLGISLRGQKEAQQLRVKGIRVCNGYLMKYAPNHPRAMRKSGTVPIHFLIVEQMIGRPLEKEEVVHHIDLVRTNNSPDNLYVYKNTSDHFSAHFHLMQVAAELYKLGVIGFKDGRYYLKEKTQMLDPQVNQLEGIRFHSALMQRLTKWNVEQKANGSAVSK